MNICARSRMTAVFLTCILLALSKKWVSFEVSFRDPSFLPTDFFSLQRVKLHCLSKRPMNKPNKQVLPTSSGHCSFQVRLGL